MLKMTTARSEKIREAVERMCHWRKTMQRLVVFQVKSIYRYCQHANTDSTEERTRVHVAHVVHATAIVIVVVAVAMLHVAVIHHGMIHSRLKHWSRGGVGRGSYRCQTWNAVGVCGIW